jgi:uncharacterized protein YbcC (UPF0753/DUF2309 family)
VNAATATAVTTDSIDRGPDRTRLLTDVRLAGGVLSQAWPIETFIAVNPLGGFENLPFDQAVSRAGEVLGARGTLDESLFRRAHAEGRVTSEELLAAARRRVPAALAAEPIRVGGNPLAADELILCDLLHGDPAPPAGRAERTIAESLSPPIAAEIDAQTSKWVSAFLDGGQAGWTMPNREAGFHTAWRDLAARDRTLPKAVREGLKEIPERADDTALRALERLGVASADQRAYVRAHVTRMPGWSAQAKWQGEHGGGIDLLSLVAMRLAYEAGLLEDEFGAGSPAFGWTPSQGEHAGGPVPGPDPDDRASHVAAVLAPEDEPSAGELAAVSAVLGQLPVAERGLVWLDAYESHYRDRLVESLNVGSAGEAERPAAQLVCCIDARSEGLRRHVEQAGPYETLGFAGFFAVAIRYQSLAGGAPDALCPVLLEPSNEISEVPAGGAENLAARQLAGQRALAGAEDSFHSAEADIATPFVLAETTGWAAGPLAAAKTLFAGGYGSLRDRLNRSAVPPAPTVVTAEQGFTLEERSLFAEVALTMMGLTGPFGRLVVLSGHGSTTENNPYEAALDCGACGGNRGAPNARTAAAILNGSEVRSYLSGKGIEIPEDTWFVAAEHDTATDTVTLLDRHLIPESHLEEMDRFADDLATAGAELSAERSSTLPGAREGLSPSQAARHVRGRSTDWAQVFPEWGLAGNAAFIVGPRSMTRGLDLQRRTFLHSYEAGIDTEGEALETILTAPMVVAQWINCQYYFSTVDPVNFGAGSKTVHNVVGGVGVLAGHGGDLKLGLPWQSVADGDRLIHEPMRLLTIVQAPLERIDMLIERNTVLQELFGNGWVALCARGDADQPWKRHTPHGWKAWNEQEESK